jgi:hypothetical protein
MDIDGNADNAYVSVITVAVLDTFGSRLFPNPDT